MIATSCYGILWVVLCGVNLFGKGDGACQWPTAVRDTQWHSSRGVITFTSTNMDGWAFQPGGSTGSSVSAWECLSSANFATDGTLIMLTRTSFNEFVRISTNYYAYLCITLTQVTTASYQFYIRNEVPPDWGSERLYLSIVNSVTEPSRICNYTHGASGPEYNMLIRVGSESAAKVTCPYTFLGRYGYTHFSSRGYFTCSAATSELDACTNTQHMKFNYTACSTSVTFSQSDTVWCVNNVFMNDANYVTTFNGNDADGVIDNTNFYRYACMAVWSNASAASVAPQQCRSGQTPGAFVTTHAGIMLGGQLTTLSSRGASCQKCETLSNPPRGNVAIATSGSVTTATYTCQASYTLWGNVSRVCQADNKWSGAEPFCNCAVPPTPASGSVLVNSDGTVATFSCNVGYTLSGIRTRTCQNGLTWDGSNPTCEKCQTLTSVSGQSSALTTNATVTSATFTCANGYTLNGTASMTCNSTGNWNAVQPACIICKTLTNPLSGTVTLSTNGQVTKATYSCSSGYTLQGVANRTCFADGNWDGADSTCSCDAPVGPSGGSVASTGSVALYTCNLGFTISGSAFRTCQSDGSGWSGTNPTCNICVTLTTVVGGNSSLTTNGIQTSATYTCNVGFTLNGESQITCQSTGVWSPAQPTCVKCSSLDHPSSGRVTLLTSGTKTSATYSCSSGYSLNGVTIRLCNPDGSWSLSAPTCTCIGPPSIGYGNVTSDGSKATYMCHLGYSISGVSSRTCSSTGSGWSDTDPTCTTCATLPSPTGGAVLLTTDGLNTKATYSCLTGYTLNGVSPITCRSDGTWNFVAPTCAKCPDLVDPSSGTKIIISTGGVTQASFYCATGYYLSGASQLTCKTDGSWDKPAPMCKCNFPLAIANGGVSVSDSAGATVAAYRCDRGYSLSGLDSRLCMSNGSGWQGADPSCTVCQTLPVPSTGTITYATNGTHTIASFRCASGSTLKGNSELTCQSNGQWNSGTPTCVSCPTPGTITSGSVSMTTTGTVTTATYTCMSGYELTSLGTLTCQVTGNWDRSSPTCVCVFPPLIANGYFEVSLDKTTVTYTCNVNYIIVGGATRTCKTDGTGWSGIAPSCVDPALATLPVTENQKGDQTGFIVAVVLLVIGIVAAAVVASIFIYRDWRNRKQASRVASSTGHSIQTPKDVNDMLPNSKPDGEKPKFSQKYERHLHTTDDTTLSTKDIDAPISNGHVTTNRGNARLPLNSVRLPALSSIPPAGHIDVGNKRKRKKIGELRKSSARSWRPKTPQERVAERIMTPDLLSAADFSYILPQFCHDVEKAIEADFVARKKSERLKMKKRRKSAKSAKRERPVNTIDAGPVENSSNELGSPSTINLSYLP